MSGANRRIGWARLEYPCCNRKEVQHTCALSCSLSSASIAAISSALDMEAETIVIVGEAVGMKAGVLLAVHGNRGTDTWLEAYEEAQDRLIRIACESMLQIRS